MAAMAAMAAAGSSDFDWDSVDSVADLNAGVIRFLRGELPTSPWHLDPVDEETLPIVESLVHLNELGYITSQGQPGTFIYPIKNIKTGEIVTSKKDPDVRYIELQHGYIDGIISKSKIHTVLSRAMKDSTVCVCMYDYSNRHSTFLNLPTEGASKDIDGTTYNLTIELGTPDGTTIVSRKSYTNYDFGNIQEAADEFLTGIQNSDLNAEIQEKYVFISFIHNQVGSLDEPDGGLGLEKKVAGFLAKERRRSVSVSRRGASASASASKTKTVKARSSSS
jgi:hypothetical protein